MILFAIVELSEVELHFQNTRRFKVQATSRTSYSESGGTGKFGTEKELVVERNKNILSRTIFA